MSKSKSATETKPIEAAAVAPDVQLQRALEREHSAKRELEAARTALDTATALDFEEIEDRIRRLTYALRDRERETQRCREVVAEATRRDDLVVLARLTLEADPMKGRAQISECAKRKRESDQRALEAVSDAALVIAEKRAVHARAVELARKLGVPGPSFPALPAEQFRWALLAMTDSGFEKLARYELEKISPGTQLGDLDPRAFLIALAEHGADAAIEPLRARDAEKHARQRAALDQIADAKRRMTDRIAELTSAARLRRLLDEESRELAQLQMLAGQVGGAHLFLAQESAAAAARSMRAPVAVDVNAPTIVGREARLP